MKDQLHRLPESLLYQSCLIELFRSRIPDPLLQSSAAVSPNMSKELLACPLVWTPPLPGSRATSLWYNVFAARTIGVSILLLAELDLYLSCLFRRERIPFHLLLDLVPESIPFSLPLHNGAL
jgi:hypothetical protein